VQNRETNLGGVPIDPNVGSANGYAQIAPGLPRDWSFGNETDARHRARSAGARNCSRPWART
jgi:iron complex outermembrane receptor protein